MAGVERRDDHDVVARGVERAVRVVRELRVPEGGARLEDEVAELVKMMVCRQGLLPRQDTTQAARGRLTRANGTKHASPCRGRQCFVPEETSMAKSDSVISDATREKIGQLAERLGRLAATVQNKTEELQNKTEQLLDRQALRDEVTKIRDAAAGLLEQLAGGITRVAGGKKAPGAKASAVKTSTNTKGR